MEDKVTRSNKQNVQETGKEKERKNKIESLMEERELAFSEEEKDLVKWKAPARPFKERNREYFTTVGAMVILLAVILLFAREFLLIAVILAFSFVVYALASVKPEEVEHTITSRGIRTGGKFYRWDALGRFWFEEKFGQKILVVETFLGFPRRLMMLMGDKSEEELKKLLATYVLLEKPEPTAMDKSAKWLQEKVPLETS